MAASGVTQALAAAKSKMSDANALTKSVEGTTPSRFAPKPVGQHADAPYKMARSAKTSSSIMDEAKSAAEGLASKQQNVKEYEDATK